jgi:nucleoside-diphosphate-sugar epimerase
MGAALVTGAAGFTGRYVVRALQSKGFRVVGAGLGTGPASNWISCDLTDTSAVNDAIAQVMPKVVVHLAGMAFVGDGHPEDFYRVNVFGTLNLLEALFRCERKPDRVLIASSANVYGNATGQELTEETCPAPVNHYAASKLAMEHLAKTWFDRLPIVITRPFNYTGPGQDERFVVPKIVGHYRRRAARIQLGDISVERDFSDVQDVVEAYMRLIESDVRSQIVNICTGRTVSVAGILASMKEIAGYEIHVQQDQELMRSSEISRLVGSNRKLLQLTGFVPCTFIQKTLKRMYAEQG